MRKHFHNQRGQGLLELVIAIGVIVTGLFSVWTLYLSNFSGEQESSYRIIGSNLAREGVEVVKNIRDSNWLKLEDNERCLDVLCRWDNGLWDVSGTIDPGPIQTAIINTQTDVDYAILNFNPDSIDDLDARLYINNETGLYASDSADAALSPFSRLITLKQICCPDVDNNLKCDSISFNDCGDDMTGKLNIAVDVESNVSWSINGKKRNIIVADTLYDWK